jgi:O-acetyl-ADP-ribose deacetylase (regulator of RNase III)
MDQNKVVGEVALLKHKERFVYYLVTKERYWNKPTYQTLTSSLEKMRDHAVNNGVKMICMPKIGCGLDKLEWYKVRWNIKQTFKGTGIKLFVYSYDPNQ